MTERPTEQTSEGGAPAPRGRRITVVLAVALLLAGVVTAVVVLPRGGPGPESAEAGFARDMSTHHAQAVKMSFIVRDHTKDPDVRLLAFDIINTQSVQIGMMTAWLDRWDAPKVDPKGPMRWMTGHGGGHPAAPGRMPGMATPQQLAALEKGKDRQAEVLYLRLMIAHHRGGVTMAQAILARTKDEQVRRLARTMVAGQQSEIDLMTRMLNDRPVAFSGVG